MVKIMEKIILVSTSSRRKMLLERFIRDLNVISPKIDENKVMETNSRKRVIKAALMKAESVLDEVKDGIVIAADTVIELDGEIIGKPKDLKEAKEILLKLSGRKHRVITGIAVIDCENERRIVDSVETEVYMKKLSNEEIELYIKTGESLGKAGGYAIQGLGSVLIDRINGCFYNVMGLPIPKLYEILRKMNVNLLSEYLKGGREH